MAGVTFEAVTKRFGRNAAVDRVDLEIREGEFLALLGPSGCGKTTLLRLVAGFEAPDAGTVRLGGEAVSGPGWALAPERRRIGMVFQSYALWPHMDVAENVRFALRVRRVPVPEREGRVAAALDAVGLAPFASRKPHQLSGGQRQRVALARCLAMRPRVVLLDEPLANLDAHLREAMQGEFARLHREIGATFVYVTHDQAEAMALADRIAVMHEGRLQQEATPQALYREPGSEMVARFVGRGVTVPVAVIGTDGGRPVVDLWGVRFPVRGEGSVGERRLLCLRAPDLSLASEGIAARVASATFGGGFTVLTVRPDGAPDAAALRLEHRGEAPPAGAPVRVHVADAWLLPRHAPA